MFSDKATLQTELNSIEQRLDTFLGKLNERADLLLQGFLAEAPTIMASDNIHGQAYYRFLSATRGQISTLRQKVNEAKEKQIDPLVFTYSRDITSPLSHLVYEWRNRCYDKIHHWEEALHARETKAIVQAEAKDYEAVFQGLIDQYNVEKEKVHCKQCGAKLVIEGMYYYSTYIPCPFCQTQNIFDPGTNARQLEETARKLAEQRSKPILEEHEACNHKERELYHRNHELQLSLIHEKDPSVIRDKKNTIREQEAQRIAAQQKAPLLLEQYYRSVFDEMSKLLPDLREHNERFFQSIQSSYLQHKINHSL